MPEASFKERVRQEMIRASKRYREIYLDYEYLICSEAFERKKYYIVSAEKDNFQHLTGVHALIGARDFFDKCYEETLQESDFDFVKRGQDEKSVKGTVRRKMSVLPDMMELFRNGTQVEENFKKNRITCSFATANGSCTLGFSETERCRPKSLIKGNELKNPKTVELILRKKSGEAFFDEVLVGDEVALDKYRDEIMGMLDRKLIK